mmetsp:Transcript_36963/g.106684  ORF Transcript_36963/g.106684 Transcript_36963/m.106684 type:complete len:218 (-) Transcript_36963:234-887(-)
MCSQFPLLLWATQAAVFCKTPIGCVRSNMRTMSRTERQLSRYSKTTTSKGSSCWRHTSCWVAGRQTKAATGKTQCASPAKAGASWRSRIASIASLKCSACGLTHFASLPACATMKMWFIPPPWMRLAPWASGRPNMARRPSGPKRRCSSGANICGSDAAGEAKSSAGSAYIGKEGQGCRCGATAPAGGQQEHGGLSKATVVKSKFTQKTPEWQSAPP